MPPQPLRIRSTAEQLLLPVWLPPEDVAWTAHSQAVVGEIQRALVEALGAWVTGDSPVELRVTIATYEARFDKGTWSGITSLSAQALRSGQPTGRAATSTKRVDRHNWLGYSTARSVLKEALESSLADLLAQLHAAPAAASR